MNARPLSPGFVSFRSATTPAPLRLLNGWIRTLAACEDLAASVQHAGCAARRPLGQPGVPRRPGLTGEVQRGLAASSPIEAVVDLGATPDIGEVIRVLRVGEVIDAG